MKRLLRIDPGTSSTCGSSRAVRVVLVLAAVLAVMLAVTACGSDESGAPGGSPTTAGEPPARPTGTLRIALAGEPQTVDPTRSPSAHEVTTQTAIYEGLLTRTSDNFDELSPNLATAWRSNADATEWTFTLRRGVKFSDGAAFDAAAAKKSIEFYARRTSIYAFAVGDIAAIETPDAHTLVVKYDKPYADLASFMAIVKMISPKLLTGSPAEVERRVATQAVGTGPYVLDSFSPSRGLTMHANPDYWGDGPYIEKLDFRPIPEESARNAALLSGDIDLVTGVSPRSLQQFASNPSIESASIDSWTTNFLNMSTVQKPFDDVRVRQALAYAIDPAAIARAIKLGQATVNGALMPPGTLGYARPTTQYTYDPDKAKALLQQAGLQLPVKVSMVTFTGMPDGATMGQALVEQARAAGFDIKLSVVPDAAGNSELYKEQRRWQIFLLAAGWANGGPLHFPYIPQRTHYTGRGAEMIAKVFTVGPGPARERLIGDTLEVLAEDVPEIPLFSVTFSDAFTSRLKGHVPPKDGFLPDWSKQYLAGQ